VLLISCLVLVHLGALLHLATTVKWLWHLKIQDIYIYLLGNYVNLPGQSSFSHMSNRKNPGNTKYVFDGHWFMEIDGTC